MQNKIHLSDHFTYPKLFRFVMPSIGMMLFMSFYGIVDGFFVSNYAGKSAFAATNLVWPIAIILGSFGALFGAGGAALVAATLGRKRNKLANEYFSLIIYTAIACGLCLTVVGFFLLKPSLILMGASDELMVDSLFYGKILMVGLVAHILQLAFQSFFTAAGKPNYGFYMTLLAGITNIVLDFVLVGILGLGLAGAAIATVASLSAGGFTPLIYFARNNSSMLRLCRTRWTFAVIYRTCYNGISELISGIAGSFVSLLYNFQLMRLSGENGVAAYGIVMYTTYIFFGIFMGYSSGSAPLASYNYGAKNYAEQTNLFKKSLLSISVSGLLLFAIAQACAPGLAQIFVGYDRELTELTIRAFRISCFTLLIVGYNIYGSALFTALNNGTISGIISISRTIIFTIISIIVLPAIFGLDGVWITSCVSEIGTILLTTYFITRKRKVYGYLS